MKYITKLKLAAAHQICDHEDRSTEYTIQYLQDTCKVDFDCAMSYLRLSEKQLANLRSDVNEFLKFLEDNYNN